LRIRRKSLKRGRLVPDDFHAYNNGCTAAIGGRHRAMDGTPQEAHMRQQVKVTVFRLAPVLMLVVTVAAPKKW